MVLGQTKQIGFFNFEEDGRIDLNRLLKENRMKLAFNVFEIASLNVVRGVIRAFGIDSSEVVIIYQWEVDKTLARKRFPDSTIREGRSPSMPNEINITFDNAVNLAGSSDSGFKMPYGFFKYNLPKPVSNKEKLRMKKKMGLSGEREVWVASSSSNEDTQTILSAYSKEDISRRPLLILGPRWEDKTLKNFLVGQGYRVLNRNASDQNPLEPFNGLAEGEPMASADIVILGPELGELAGFLALANAGIISSDHNLMEMVNQGDVPLILPGKWYDNRAIKNFLTDFGASEETYDLHEQINVRRNSDLRAKNHILALKAKRQFQRVLMPASVFIASAFIASKIQAHASGSRLSASSIISKMRQGEPLAAEDLTRLGFSDENAFFYWIQRELRTNTELMGMFQGGHWDRARSDGGIQVAVLIEAALPFIKKKLRVDLAPITVKAFELTQRRLGGLVAPFFIPEEFYEDQEVLALKVTPVTEEEIKRDGASFFRKYFELMESCWKRGIFDYDFKPNGLGQLEDGRLVVMDFGLSKDAMNADELFNAPDALNEWETRGESKKPIDVFQTAIMTIHRTYWKLSRASQAAADEFKRQWDTRYKIQLIERRGTYPNNGALEPLAEKLRNVVKQYEPKVAMQHRVYPFIGEPFDSAILKLVDTRMSETVDARLLNGARLAQIASREASDVLRSKYGIRHILRGGPADQPGLSQSEGLVNLAVLYGKLNRKELKEIAKLVQDDFRVLGMFAASRRVLDKNAAYPLVFQEGYVLLDPGSETDVIFYKENGEKIGSLTLTNEQIKQGHADLDKLKRKALDEVISASRKKIPAFVTAAGQTIQTIRSVKDGEPVILNVIGADVLTDNKIIKNMVKNSVLFLQTRNIYLRFGKVEASKFVPDETYKSFNSLNFPEGQVAESYVGSEDSLRQLDLSNAAGIGLIEQHHENQHIRLLETFIRVAEIRRYRDIGRIKQNIRTIADPLAVEMAEEDKLLYLNKIPADFNEHKEKYLKDLKPFTILALKFTVEEMAGYVQMVMRVVAAAA
jgi:hypothetical protein